MVAIEAHQSVKLPLGLDSLPPRKSRSDIGLYRFEARSDPFHDLIIPDLSQKRRFPALNRVAWYNRAGVFFDPTSCLAR